MSQPSSSVPNSTLEGSEKVAKLNAILESLRSQQATSTPPPNASEVSGDAATTTSALPSRQKVLVYEPSHHRFSEITMPEHTPTAEDVDDDEYIVIPSLRIKKSELAENIAVETLNEWEERMEAEQNAEESDSEKDKLPVSISFFIT
jgi:hypothetical protein